jgi:hypothetical protein
MTLRFYLTPVRTAVIKTETSEMMVMGGGGGKRTYLFAIIYLAQPLGKFLKKFRMLLPYDPCTSRYIHVKIKVNLK